MEYLARTTKDHKRKQPLKEHLQGTARLSGSFAQQFGCYDWGYCCGYLHDIGKYSDAFQERLNGSSKQVDHSTAGARVCWEQKGYYPLMGVCIAGHHTGLLNYGGSTDTGNVATVIRRKKKKLEDYQAYKQEIQIPQLKTQPFDSTRTDNFDFSLSVFIRMLYSCLVDADFLDTERFMQEGKIQRDPGESMENLMGKLENHIAGWLAQNNPDTVNGRRTEILKHCLERGKSGKGMFRLTVPTGGGKTVASLAFALRHAVQNQMRRIIYVIPYTSIIEQNAEVFRKVLGDENVLENHCHVDYSSREELNPMQLASENWDKPVVVTTNVQFFESLFANKPSRCRKLHNIANSVIIFDEVQMLPNDYLKPCIAMMEELLRNYGVSIVLCTATQPALTSFFPGDREIEELCPRMEEQFQFFKRVSFENIGTAAEEELAERLRKEKQALCIVNTRKTAQSLYERLRGEGVYHLSTSMYPGHRQRVLGIVRQRLAQGKSCILISTSLVEAGVDLDFETVFRQLAGIDSMIQAAGRCNREGRRKAKGSRVIIFQMENQGYVPGQRQQMDAAKSLLADGYEISSLDTIEKYFRNLYNIKGESLDKKNIMEEFRKEKRGKCDYARIAEEFKLIENNTYTIFIPQEEEAASLLQQMKWKGYTRSGMRKAEQYCVQVYEKDFDIMKGAGMVSLVSEDIHDFYQLTDLEQYTEEMGLKLSVEEGAALFL